LSSSQPTLSPPTLSPPAFLSNQRARSKTEVGGKARAGRGGVTVKRKVGIKDVHQKGGERREERRGEKREEVVEQDN